ncbi:MAG: phosphoribosyltransferase [Burkholderiales bacterium]|nr:phosphoribosyltransferase [Burkholderiales bacterium]
MRHELFEDRVDAGQKLAAVLRERGLQDAVVLALPRGGVPVAVEVAHALNAPLDLLLVRKIGARGNPELAVAAVADAQEPVIEVEETTLTMTGTSLEDVQRAVPQQLEEIERRRRVYLKGRAPVPVKGKTVVLVDDGIATGTTMRAALRALRQRQPARVIVAVPVAPAEEVERFLRDEVGELICLAKLQSFGAVGAHYRNFDQTTDEEVIALMNS